MSGNTITLQYNDEAYYFNDVMKETPNLGSKFGGKTLLDAVNREDVYEGLKKFSDSSNDNNLTGQVNKVELDADRLQWVEFSDTQGDTSLKIDFTRLKDAASEIGQLNKTVNGLYCRGIAAVVLAAPASVVLAADAMLLSIGVGLSPVWGKIIAIGVLVGFIYSVYREVVCIKNDYSLANEKLENLKKDKHWDTLNPVYKQIEPWRGIIAQHQRQFLCQAQQLQAVLGGAR